MIALSRPLQVVNNSLLCSGSIKESIDVSLSLLISTPLYSFPSDPQYGFVFNNFRFEIFNEREGVIYDSAFGRNDDFMMSMYDKKISGSSSNLNTFASILKEAVINNEKRLAADKLKVSMVYLPDEKMIYVTIKSTIIASGEDYLFQTKIRTWN